MRPPNRLATGRRRRARASVPAGVRAVATQTPAPSSDASEQLTTGLTSARKSKKSSGMMIMELTSSSASDGQPASLSPVEYMMSQ